VMTTAGLKLSQRTEAMRVSLPLAMSALSLPTSQASTSNRVTDEARFTEALGAERLTVTQEGYQ
jgi:hypothetical protein